MPNAMIHPTSQELSAFALGKLADGAAATVARHLETCPACRKALDSLPADSFVGKVRAAKPGVSALAARASGATNMPTSAGANSPPPKDLPPDLANYSKYRFVRELGRGGMGVVYQAEQTVMGRSVAVKVINPSVLDHPDALPRFQSEVRAAAKLDHPNIVRAYDAEQVGSMHLLVMEYVEGNSLAELVAKKGPLSVPYACHYVRQAALGLQHAFEQGMVHRDIKPQNLMVNARGQVKVLDFGLARMRSERKQGGGLTQADAFMGTPEYVSPEQATDARSADTRADIYSLGCTLFFLLTGRPPFKEDTIVKLILSHIEKEAPALHEVRPEVPVELSAVVVRMLAKDPGQRFQTPVEVAQALAAFVKPGTKGAASGSASASGASSPGTGTMIVADTNQIKAILRDVPGKVPAPDAPAKAAATSAFTDLGEPVASAKKKAKPAQKSAKRVEAVSPRSSKRKWLIGGSVAVSVLLLALLGMWAGGVFKVKTKDGTIVLQDLPADAEVLVDDGTVTVKWSDGKTAEVRVAPGKKHRIQVKKEGFKVFGEEVEVDAGGSKPLLVRLEKPVARIVLQNLPTDAEVFVDGAKATVERDKGGKTAQFSVVSGRHKIVATKDGINVLGEDVEIKDGELQVLRVTLREDSGEAKWLREVAAQPAESQVKAVADKLKERNPGFDGAVKPTIKNGVVTGLEFVTDHVTDISPLRALSRLTRLSCRGSGDNKGKLTDLTPLKGMNLTHLTFDHNKWIWDLSPLRGMPLTSLMCWGTGISDLSPLKGMPLTFLTCGGTQVSDLSPLKDMKLTALDCWCTPVSDLSPLKGMPLTSLQCWFTRVSDLSPLKGMKLTSLGCPGTRVSDLSPLRDIPLTYLNCHGTRVSDLSPLKGMPLAELHCKNTPVSDLAPLKDIPLKILGCDFKPERDTEILRSIRTLEKIDGKPVAQFWKEVDGTNTSGGSPMGEKGPSRDKGFVPLFNGKDLTGWKPQPGDKAKWEVKDGILIGSGGLGHLFSQRGDYKDFHLSVEALINDGGNSGVYFRTQFGPGFPKGYEAQINSTHGDTIRGGSLYPSFGPPKEDRDKIIIKERLYQPNEWFTQEVITKGNHLVIKVNGKTTVDYVDPQNTYKQGYFALQGHDPGMVVKFRKIEIKELPLTKEEVPPAAHAAEEKGFVPLFNGKNLNGWKTHPKQPGNWRVVKGVLIGSGPAISHLYSSRGNYKNFHLRVEARINDGGNSGLYFRAPSGPFQPPNNPTYLLGYEAQINASSRDPRKTGSLIGMVPVAEPPHKPNEWFTEEVIAQESHIVIKVNGRTTADHTDDKRLFTRGHIALQQLDAATVVEFRKIEIKELK